jgi:hypothetical protein
MSDLPSTRCTVRAGTTGAATALTPPTGPVPAAMQQTACWPLYTLPSTARFTPAS